MIVDSGNQWVASSIHKATQATAEHMVDCRLAAAVRRTGPASPEARDFLVAEERSRIEHNILATALPAGTA